MFSLVLASLADESSSSFRDDGSIEKAPLKNEPSMEKLDGRIKYIDLYTANFFPKCFFYKLIEEKRESEKEVDVENRSNPTTAEEADDFEKNMAKLNEKSQPKLRESKLAPIESNKTEVKAAESPSLVDAPKSTEPESKIKQQAVENSEKPATSQTGSTNAAAGGKLRVDSFLMASLAIILALYL